MLFGFLEGSNKMDFNLPTFVRIMKSKQVKIVICLIILALINLFCLTPLTLRTYTDFWGGGIPCWLLGPHVGEPFTWKHIWNSVVSIDFFLAFASHFAVVLVVYFGLTLFLSFVHKKFKSRGAVLLIMFPISVLIVAGISMLVWMTMLKVVNQPEWLPDSTPETLWLYAYMLAYTTAVGILIYIIPLTRRNGVIHST